MCGRFTITRAKSQIATLFDKLELIQDLQPDESRFNVAPTQEVFAVRKTADSSGLELVKLRWGLIPAWAENPKAALLVNARCETLLEKPSFREAFKKRRCLIPADGFFEWKQEDGRKQPYWIHRADGEPFTFAGIWERWTNDSGSVIESCAIVTTRANALLRPLHERMPVIVPVEWRDRWLDLGRSLDDLRDLFRPAPEDELTMHPVSSLVNSARMDSERCIEEVAAPRQLSLWDE
jgi:putative SOS response-associated peptidase YedK